MLLVIAASSVAGATVHPPGADPTGRTDSSFALNAEIARLCAASVVFRPLASYAISAVPADAELDLGGGVYRLDSPLLANTSVPCTGRLRITRGTLLAGPGLAFHGNWSFLVAVVGYMNTPALGVTLEKLNFASNFTGGGLRVDAYHHVHVYDVNFLNFFSYGVWGSSIEGMAHDLTIERCRFTECTAGFDECGDHRVKRATAILLEFPDSHVRNSVITCGLVGIVNRGGSNTFHEMHIWPSCNPTATGANLTVALRDEAGNTRISDSYIDNSRLQIARYRGTTVTNTYFNGHATLELLPPATSAAALNGAEAGMECQYWRGQMCGLLVTNNRFACGASRCGTLTHDLFIPPAADQIHVSGNHFANASAAVCSRSPGTCQGSDCADLFGACT
mmetsp:Transcript_56472/g.126090  ORF Transcript_56472/g.126090 Transcript_56472/m.126090 type:complete len:392 (-) Transcript_56472:571-1746(-)